MNLERYFIDVMRGKKEGLVPTLLRGGLWLMSLPYQLAVRFHTWAFDTEWYRQYHPPIPLVVSVGNFVVGGTGKTPVAIMLAKEFYDERMIAILSRGYRSPAEKLPAPVVLSAGKGPLHSAAYCGDEPYLLAENLPKACVYVGRNRQKTAVLAAKAGVELAILDDGMQHRQVARDYEIVVMDALDPLGHNYHLPRGFLRESPKSLSRADLVVVNHVGDKASFDVCKKLVEKYTKAPVIGTHFALDKCFDLQKNEIESLKDKKAAIFCGIGQPDRFIETVKRCGVTIIGEELYSDHAPYYADQISHLADKYKAQGAEMLICTEKDMVKIPEITALSLPIVWLKMEMKVVENEEGWYQFIHKLRTDLTSRSPQESNQALN